jgi:predicted amidophosphoribosyltransferase
MSNDKPVDFQLTPSAVQRCGFVRLDPVAGYCKECDEPADPTTRPYCSNCAIARGIEPLKPAPDPMDETK